MTVILDGQLRRELEAEGFVVLRAKSYRAEQEKRRTAKALLDSEIRHAEQTREWARGAFAAERKLAERCSYLYGLAVALGATEEQLQGGFTE